MSIKDILKQNLSVVKGLINEDALKIKIPGENLLIFHCFFIDNKKIEVIEYLLTYVKEKAFYLLYDNSFWNNSILHCVLRNKSNFKVLKYTFNFVKNNCPSLFLQKNYGGYTFFYDLILFKRNRKSIKYILKFTSINFPDLLLIKINNTTIVEFMLYDCGNVIEDIIPFFTLNCPEILTDKTCEMQNSHLILPLTFQIQN